MPELDQTGLCEQACRPRLQRAGQRGPICVRTRTQYRNEVKPSPECHIGQQWEMGRWVEGGPSVVDKSRRDKKTFTLALHAQAVSYAQINARLWCAQHAAGGGGRGAGVPASRERSRQGGIKLLPPPPPQLKSDNSDNVQAVLCCRTPPTGRLACCWL